MAVIGWKCLEHGFDLSFKNIKWPLLPVVHFRFLFVASVWRKKKFKVPVYDPDSYFGPKHVRACAVSIKSTRMEQNLTEKCQKSIDLILQKYVKMHLNRHQVFSTRCPTVEILYFNLCMVPRRIRNSGRKLHTSERRKWQSTVTLLAAEAPILDSYHGNSPQKPKWIPYRSWTNIQQKIAHFLCSRDRNKRCQW